MAILNTVRNIAGRFGGYVNSSVYLAIFAFSILSWIVFFICLAVAQHKVYYRLSSQNAYYYHTTGRRAYSFPWWVLIYQLFVLGFLNHGVKTRFFNNQLALSFTIIALIQEIIIADRYIYSFWRAEKGIAIGSLLLAIANFAWLSHYSWATSGNRGVPVDEEKTVSNNGNYNAGTTGAGAAGAGAGAGAAHDSRYDNTGTNTGVHDNRNVGPGANTGDYTHEKNAPSVSDTHNTHSTAVQDVPTTPQPAHHY